MAVQGSPQLGGAARADAELLNLAKEDTPHGPGFGLITTKQPGKHFDIQVFEPLAGSIKKGDVIYAEFWARALSGARYETGEGYTLFRIQRDGPDWERGLYREWVLGPGWKKYFIAERFNHTLPEGEIVAAFSGGYPAQHIEIAGLEVRNLGPDADLDALPTLEVEYVGSEPDAAWRRSALGRIEQHRKGDLTIELRDANGNPVPNAEINVEMTRHRFGFGVAISASWLDQNWDTPAGQKYRETILEHFNAVALENALKWSRWEREPEVALRTLRWAKDNGLQTHGHVLVWPGLEKFRVEDAAELWAAAQDDPQLLRHRVNDHIRSILEGTDGLVDVWDVVNEAYNQNEFIELLGESEVAEWFKLADTYAPEATLFYNDFGLVGQSGTNRVKQQFVADLIQGVRDRGGRVDAVGLQSHLGSGLTPPPRVLDIIEFYANNDLAVKITEYDLNVDDPELAERYTRDFLIAAFSHPAVTGFQGWNFWSATPTWMPEASYFGDDWEWLPVGRAYRDLVLNEWWTRETVTTDDQGRASVRGFLGDYRLRTAAGELIEPRATINPEGSSVVLRLK
ncbi:MAG: endo-1,4-beta-xylanase [Planctomycetota bacterium]